MTVLEYFGIIFLIVTVSCLGVALWNGFGELIDRWKRNYQIKHRFDKPPTAACYCVDCRYHNNKSKVCYRFGETTKEYRCTADEWFCWEADPDPNKKVEE